MTATTLSECHTLVKSIDGCSEYFEFNTYINACLCCTNKLDALTNVGDNENKNIYETQSGSRSNEPTL